MSGDVYMRALADAGAVGLGDLTPGEEAKVRDQARKTFAQQVPIASTKAVAAIKKAVSGTASKVKAAVTPAPSPTSSGSPFRSDLVWLGALGVAIVGGAIAYKYMKPRPRKRNPEASSSGAGFYKLFHWGRRHRGVKRVKVPPAPAELVALGKLRSVVYTAKKGSDPIADYEHEFEGPLPTLACDPKRKRLHIVGGGYTVEERGIVG